VLFTESAANHLSRSFESGAVPDMKVLEMLNPNTAGRLPTTYAEHCPPATTAGTTPTTKDLMPGVGGLDMGRSTRASTARSRAVVGTSSHYRGRATKQTETVNETNHARYGKHPGLKWGTARPLHVDQAKQHVSESLGS
jgi:hypothetical protein